MAFVYYIDSFSKRLYWERAYFNLNSPLVYNTLGSFENLYFIYELLCKLNFWQLI